MIDIKEIFKKYKNIYQYIQRNKVNIKGSLVIDDRSKNPYFYHSINSKERKYIPNSNKFLIKSLAQKKYYSELEKWLKEVLPALEALQDFDQYCIDNVYNSLKPAIKSIIPPITKTWDIKLKEWEENKITTKNKFFSNEFPTKNGEFVRSKSEKIISDLLSDYNLNFQYERPIDVDGVLKYPDFTIYSKKHNMEIYWEHFGFIDNEEYREKMLAKLSQYANAGIVVGYNLITTYESKSTPLNIRNIEEIIRKNF